MQTRIALNDSRIRIPDTTGRIAKGDDAESDENREIGTLGTGTMLPSLRHMRKKREPEQFVNTCAQGKKFGYSVPALVTSGSVWKSRPPEMPGRRWAIRKVNGQASSYPELVLRELAQWIRQSTFMPVYPGGHSEPTLSFKLCSIVRDFWCPPRNLQLYTETSTETL